MVERPESAGSAPVDLSGVLAELNLVLEQLTGLTDEEQARVARKMQEIREREAAPPPAPATSEAPVLPAPPPAEPPAPVAPPPPPLPREEPPLVIIHDGTRPPTPPPPAAAPAPEPPVPVAASPAPAPAETPTPAADGGLAIAVFYPPGGEVHQKAFVKTLVHVAKTKAKKPMPINTVLAQVSDMASGVGPQWISGARSAGAECFFVILPPDILAEYMESVALDARKQGMPCFFVPIAEVESKLLYVDLMVELMMMKRKK
jgi:hypothetical protein